ncbi:GAG-pre-integrase domain [Plasmopara halstedii]|uniref:GAG-pre-integrase domain n=1 Tax=Plasmopara halstedii TaxID=4781 RepID=A0A0P1B1Z2_PLAHL|nr:GAG-pre-integrase domain [Plasmopara halstedii]CEG48756.1 GAG-pre-integrase domain [Plasmopara halstedii]|eukprot:XP_024585125.1 GAG-pre-integrase domain [Plasmopara halstedii]
MGIMGARIISTVMADCTAIIDGFAGPGAAATSGGNTGTNAGTHRRQQPSNYTSRGSEVRADRREDELDATAGIAMVSPKLAVPDTKSSNVHLTGDRSLFVHLEEIHPESIGANVVGVAATTLTRASGIGRVKIITQVGDTEADVFLDDVLYMKGASHGLFSMHLGTTKQKFEISFDRAASTFSAYKNGEQVIFAVPHEGIWVFEAKRPADAPRRPSVLRVIVNYTVADGVATLEQWYNRTGHTNVQYLKIMVDRGLVRGMIITNRQLKTCDSCHIGKQRQKRR